jgi:hypothetical protein
MMVNGNCTCGAQLPPDARFCHKCGKPQFEWTPEPEQVTDVPTPVAAAPATAPPPTGVSWRNPVAVRVASLAGGLSSLLILLPVPPPINVIWAFLILIAGGFWTVHLFRKRTRVEVSVRNGARLGWMAGVFSFIVLLVVFTINIVLITTVSELREAFDAVVRSNSPEVVKEYEAMMSSPAGLAALVMAALLMCIMLPICSTIGGALGAKVLEKE